MFTVCRSLTCDYTGTTQEQEDYIFLKSIDLMNSCASGISGHFYFYNMCEFLY